MAKRKSQGDHDKMVFYAAKFLASEGGNVKADLNGWPRPESIQGYIPDITATGIIVEVETDDSIFDQHTRSQWKAFSRFAEQKKIEFRVMVPRGSRDKARARLKVLEISNGEVWAYMG